MKNPLLTALLASTLLAAGAAWPAALAQQQGAAMQQPVPLESDAVSDEQISAFITAARGVTMIAQTYQPQLQAAESEDAAMAIQQEAQGQMMSVVEQSGLSPEEYNGIAAGMQSDPELAARVNAQAEAMMGQPQ